MIKVKVLGVVIHSKSGSPIVILQEENGSKVLPIWIGIMEASAIAAKLEGVVMPRPMTHDLLNNCLAQLGVQVEKVVVTDLIDNTYYANIYLRQGDSTVLVDSRPSDAIALALRAGAPIFVEEKVFEKTLSSIDMSDVEEESELKDLLEDMDDDFGKYKM